MIFFGVVALHFDGRSRAYRGKEDFDHCPLNPLQIACSRTFRKQNRQSMV
jgi:hypothetical protein